MKTDVIASEATLAAESNHRQIGAIDLVVQAIPPVHDAIGEYTACLAAELSRQTDVRILTNSQQDTDDVGHVSLEPCFRLRGRHRFAGINDRLQRTSADAVVLQYNPFAWGRRGWAPDLVAAFEQFKLSRPDVALAVMFHETYTMSPGLRSLLMRQYQRRQFRKLVRLSDINFFSTGIWANQHRRLSATSEMVHLPVGSNLPESIADRSQIRQVLGIGPGDFVCGVFGGSHPSRLLRWIETAVSRIRELHSAPRVVLLHIGGDPINWSVDDVDVIATGRLPAVQAADAVAAMDLMVNPFSDGVSTRRTSVITALRQGVPLLTTHGVSTDAVWLQQDNSGVFLSAVTNQDDWFESIERALGQILRHPRTVRDDARQFYLDTFSWKRITDAMLRELRCAANNRRMSR